MQNQQLELSNKNKSLNLKEKKERLREKSKKSLNRYNIFKLYM